MLASRVRSTLILHGPAATVMMLTMPGRNGQPERKENQRQREIGQVNHNLPNPQEPETPRADRPACPTRSRMLQQRGYADITCISAIILC
jgi:hypothetical protein